MENSTSISDLPVDNRHVNDATNGIPDDNKGSNSLQNIHVDTELIPHQIPTSELSSSNKHINIREDKNQIHHIDTTQQVSRIDIIKESDKIIILATILFFVFQDPKVRTYILNILCQIFGDFLKTNMGNISKIGVLFYSLVYGLCMYIIVKVVDINSFNLSI
jgi:hypothetical protein